jgi:hypothetical protein
MALDAIDLYQFYGALRNPQNSENPLMNIVSRYPGAGSIEKANNCIVAYSHNDTQNCTAPPTRT